MNLPLAEAIIGRLPVKLAEVPDEVPVLVGQIPLEHPDFVVELVNRKLIRNPAHGGEQMFEMC